MERWCAHRCRGADPFGPDAPQQSSAVHIGRRDYSFIRELAHPFCVRQDTSHFAIGSPKQPIIYGNQIVSVNACTGSANKIDP